jgi:hypothetical protein
VEFKRIGGKRCRTSRLALDGPFRVGDSRPANSLKQPVQSGGSVFAEFQSTISEGFGERGGRFDGVGDVNLRVGGSPSMLINSSSGIHDY